jgi:lipopolysaccharide transport system permease protein
LALPDLGEVWRYRGLIGSMVRRQVRARFNDLFLGFFWSVARPITMTLVFIFLKHVSAAQMGVAGAYAPFLFAGLIVWFYFASALQAVANAMVRDAGLVQKVYFPRLVSTIAPLISNAVDLLIGGVILAVMLVIYGEMPDWHLLLLPLVILQLMLLVLGLGLLFAGLTILSRDWGEFLNLLLYLGLFLSPVIYSPDALPERVRDIYHFNPMVGVLSAVRSCVLGGTPFPWGDWLYSAGISVVLVFVGLHVFNYVERQMLDRL